ncbi:MAG TPA: ATP-binding protein [Solirubrobacteraceae bacterium]|nr:ATP-binding protein [Solirubrobacteraceae bacterium]
MTKSVSELLSEREGTRLDFKRDLSSMKRVLETVCSFLNTAGGTLIVGVEDRTKVVVGVNDVEKQEEKLASSVANAIDPQPTVQLEIATHDGRDLLLLRASYAAGPFFIKGKGKERGTFVRIGSNSLPASPEKIAELERARRTGAWDQEPVPGLAREDLDDEAIMRWFDAVGERPRDAKLRGIGVLAEHGGRLAPTRAGIILFGRERAAHFPDAQIRCVRFRGIDKSDPAVKGEDGEGTVLDGIEAAVGFIERNTDRVVQITGRTRREELDLYPGLAVREILNNAVAHADYAVEGASIFVALYSDRLEISSPGTWPPGFSREDFESGVSLRRNKAISRVLMRLGVIEGYGSGYDRVTAACRAGGYPEPEWIENGPQIKVLLRPHPAAGLSPRLVHDIPEGSHRTSRARVARKERHAAVLVAIEELEQPNTIDIQRRTGISTRSLGRDLRHLREAGLIEFVGAPQTGFYRRK